MKNLMVILMFASALLFSSCGADQAIVDSMADDMCKIMEKYNPDDPMSALSIIEGMTKLAEKEGYDGVSEAQLKSAMEKKCPEGAKKLQSLMDMGK